MRGKIIGVFSVVVLLVCTLAFALMRASQGERSSRGASQRTVTAAVAQLQLEGLLIERWLARQVTLVKGNRNPFDANTPKASSDAATAMADKINDAAKSANELAAVRPSLVVVVDVAGVVLGRNGSVLMRGEELGAQYPAMPETLRAGQTGSDLWINRSKNEQLLVSYAPVRDAEGAIVGGVAVATPFDNGRLQSVSPADHGALVAAVPGDTGGLEAVARHGQAGEADGAVAAALDGAASALDSDQVVPMAELPQGMHASARRLSGYGDSRRAVLLALAPANLEGAGSLLLPLLGCFALGLVLTVLAAYFIDAYISRPIRDLEDGLLSIINGATDIRFELEHTVLGGLVFRINQLLNQLLGVREDDTDDDGRPSYAPPSGDSFTAALNVDERMAALSLEEVEDGNLLRDEPPEDYYKRIYDEYLEAKKSLGDPVDHVRFAPFTERIKASERQLSEKHGKPFRYRISVEHREVVLLAVPLA